MNYLQSLESQSIYIIREVLAQCKNPAMLYSVGKDSAVLLHLVQKAFYPRIPPLPLVHIDTQWKFQEMIAFRDKRAKEVGMELIVWINPKGKELNLSPFVHGSAMHTDIMKTQALKDCLWHYGFDGVLGGARRDEEASRAKERIFSFRNSAHQWDPKNQRPEIWDLYNGRTREGEGIRIFPLSNWSELDIWEYILKERIPIPELYFAKKRLVVEYLGAKILVDDDRMPKALQQQAKEEMIRFRTLGCYPLSGGMQSCAKSPEAILDELLEARVSERAGRLIDFDPSSMEQKKQEGYF